MRISLSSGQKSCQAELHARMGFLDIFLRNRRKTCPFPTVGQNSNSSVRIGRDTAAQCEQADTTVGCLEFRESLSEGRENQTQVNKSNLMLLEQVKNAKRQAKEAAATTLRKKRRSTPIERVNRMRNIVETLNRRRNAICGELERNWYFKGTHLQKHRHNLQISQELTVRGLL